jgi:hypothetical protein
MATLDNRMPKPTSLDETTPQPRFDRDTHRVELSIAPALGN